VPAAINNSLTWIFEAFEADPSYFRKPMFGCEAAYLNGLMCLVAADRAKPWNGLLICTSQQHHASLIEQIPELQPHPVLGKWLYVSQHDAAFEAVAEHLTKLVLGGDQRIGVAPKPRPKPKRQSAKPSPLQT
jgi:hypothetical protein